jgi:outer membrane protein
MKQMLCSLVLLTLMSSCQNNQKIGFIDNTEVVNNYHKKKMFETRFQVKIDRFNKKADSLQKAIQMEAQLWQSRATQMNQSKAEEEYQALVQKKQMQDYQLSNEEKALQTEGQQQIDSLIKEVKAFVKDYGKTNGYTFILGANDAGSVMYGADTVDLTEAILDALNKSHSPEENSNESKDK